MCTCLSISSFSLAPDCCFPMCFSLCIHLLPMNHFASCAIYLFVINAQLTSLSQCPSTCSSTTHHYTTSQFVLPIASPATTSSQYHTHLLVHFSLPHHEAVTWDCTFLVTSPWTLHQLPSLILGKTSSYPYTPPCTYPHIFHWSPCLSISVYFCLWIYPYLLLLIERKGTSKYAIAFFCQAKSLFIIIFITLVQMHYFVSTAVYNWCWLDR
mgnify:CR=1 FL=1